MIHTKLLTAVAAAAVLAAPAAFAQTADAAANAQAAVAPTSPVAASNVIDTLKERGQFVTLLAALDQAQLTDTLASRPRITLFAPTDEAFAAVPAAELARLMEPANIQELRDVLLYHILVANLTEEQIRGARGPIATAGGIEITIDGTTDPIAVDTASVVQPGIPAANGGVYVINKVLTPNAAVEADAAVEAETDAAATAAPHAH